MTVAEQKYSDSVTAEGQMFVELDEVYDPKTSKKTGKPFYMASFRRDGVGTGDMFISEEIYRKLRGAARGTIVMLTFGLSKRDGTLSPWLNDAVI